MNEKISITKSEFLDATANENLSNETSQALWTTLNKQTTTNKQLNISNYAFYFGASLILIALLWFSGIFFQSKNAPGLLTLSLVYIALSAGAGCYLLRKPNYVLLGKLSLLITVLMVPLFMCSLFLLRHHVDYDYFHYFLSTKYYWQRAFLIQLATIVAAYAGYRYCDRFSPMLGVLTLAVWPLLYQLLSYYPMKEETLWYNLIIGIVFLVAALLLDKLGKTKRFFWPYCIGSLLCFFTLLFLRSNEEISLGLCVGITVLAIICGIALTRRLMTVLGLLGLLIYLVSLSYQVTGIYITITIFGILLIVGGILYSIWLRNQSNKKS